MQCSGTHRLHAALDEARRECVARGRSYLNCIARSFARDVSITTYVACGSPLAEAVVDRVRESGANLVMKSPAGRHPLKRRAGAAAGGRLTPFDASACVLVIDFAQRPSIQSGAVEH